ncbi:sensor histidine kinase [Cellulomonas sp. NPDC057328]|uniref:sensor histidine kinase n=1 Tax=Cellulomonas sp. NPDC057328 TaxID=3346101 RepID=UPI00363B9EF9
MTRWTLRRRLVTVLVALVVGVTAATGVISTLALRATLVDQLDDQVRAAGQRAGGVRAGPRVGLPWSPGSAVDGTEARRPPPGLGVPGQAAGTIALEVVDGVTEAAYLDEDGDYQPLTAEQAAVLEDVPTDGEPQTVDLPGLGPYRVVGATTTDGRLVVTGLSLREALRTVEDYVVSEAVIAALGILLAAVAGGVLVRRELRPLDRVAATAARVSDVPLHRGEVAALERVPDADTDRATEVGQVGLALNRLLGHVEAALGARHESETQVRQFVADASHELRTPLASIRGYAELVRRMPEELPPDAVRALERVESESRRMTSLVEDMLLLARLDAGRPLDRGPVDMIALALDAVSDAHAAGPDHVWRLELPDPEDDDPAGTVVLGDEHRLRQVLVNLLANARVHTPPGTTVVTSVTSGAQGSVELEVRDDGPGIPDDLRHRLFQRFARGDAARSPGSGSSGLGLAIADAVVRAHGGRIDVGRGPGATFTVTLPADPPDAPR